MAKKDTAVFTQTPRTVTAVLTAAKTTYSDGVNAVKLCDAGADGSLLVGLTGMPRATVTASQLQLYFSADGTSTALQLIDSEVMAAYTMAQTTKAPKTAFSDIAAATPIRLPIGASLWVASGVALAGGIVMRGQVEDY